LWKTDFIHRQIVDKSLKIGLFAAFTSRITLAIDGFLSAKGSEKVAA
jgi:hypothetical protein